MNSHRQGEKSPPNAEVEIRKRKRNYFKGSEECNASNPNEKSRRKIIAVCQNKKKDEPQYAN